MSFNRDSRLVGLSSRSGPAVRAPQCRSTLRTNYCHGSARCLWLNQFLGISCGAFRPQIEPTMKLHTRKIGNRRMRFVMARMTGSSRISNRGWKPTILIPISLRAEYSSRPRMRKGNPKSPTSVPSVWVPISFGIPKYRNILTAIIASAMASDPSSLCASHHVRSLL